MVRANEKDRLNNFNTRLPTGKEGLLLDETTDDAEGVVEGAIGLFEHQFVGSAKEDRDRLTGVLHTSHLQMHKQVREPKK